jgi:hypothetical protein
MTSIWVNRQPENRSNCYVKITTAPTCSFFPVGGGTVRGTASRPVFGSRPMCLAGEGEDCRIAVRNSQRDRPAAPSRCLRGPWHRIGSSGSGRTKAGDDGCAAKCASLALSGEMAMKRRAFIAELCGAQTNLVERRQGPIEEE